MVSQIKVDSILESTSAAGVTIDGVLIKDGAIPSVGGLSSAQQFLKTYMAEDTPYNGVLVNHGVGQGKTCTGITIAENYKHKIKSEKISQYLIRKLMGKS